MAEWLDVLRQEATQHGQRKVARRIGYSASVVSQVLGGSYTGDLAAVRRAVEGALLSGTVECPVLGEISDHQCIRFQRQPVAATTPSRVKVGRTCPSCPNNRMGRAHAQRQAAAAGEGDDAV